MGTRYQTCCPVECINQLTIFVKEIRGISVANAPMTSSRPYFVRALYDWILENSLTPYLVVNGLMDDVQVPQEYVNKDGQILLNIAPRAVTEFALDNDGITFKARFGGVPREIFVPISAVLGVYARENGQGMMFDPEAPNTPQPPKSKKKTDPVPIKKEGNARPSLRVVK